MKIGRLRGRDPRPHPLPATLARLALHLGHAGASLRRYLLWSAGVASVALTSALGIAALALVYADAPGRIHTVEASASDSLAALFEPTSSFFETISVHFEAAPPPEPESHPSGDEGQVTPTPPPVKSSPLIPISQRLNVPGKGNLFVKGLYQNANITFYDCADQGFCGAMYNGRKVYEGAVACSWDLALGTRLRIVGDPTQ
ncbi:MAG TPA: hypothetical protein VG845_15520, partial [Dehalococcoidia bacterium]|nr:hypothetical protein [Dehalococcoidia bacterium]